MELAQLHRSEVKRLEQGAACRTVGRSTVTGASAAVCGGDLDCGTTGRRGVVAYTLKALGYQVTTNDFLAVVFDNGRTSHALYGEVTAIAGGTVEVRHMDHRYSFGTHATARRRKVSEYLFIGR